MRRRQPAIELPHLHVVEVLGAGGRKDGERHRGPRLAVREARARGDHPGDERVGKSDPGRHARAAGHAGQVDAPGIDGEPAADVGGHGLRRLRRDSVRAVPRVVRRGDDVTVLLGGGPEFLDHQRASGRRMKGENHAPLPLRGIDGRQVQGVGLRGIVGAHHALERNATLRCLRRRGARAQHQRHEQARLQKAHDRTHAGWFVLRERRRHKASRNPRERRPATNETKLVLPAIVAAVVHARCALWGIMPTRTLR